MIALILTSICIIIPVRLLIILGIIGVILADVQWIPKEYVYYTRFIPTGILAMRVFFISISKHTDIFSNSMVKAWTPFFLMALISSVYSLEPQITVQRAVSGIFVLIGVGLGIQHYLNRLASQEQLLKMIMFIFLLFIIWSFRQGFSEAITMGWIGDPELSRIGGFFNPNSLGIFSMQVFFILFYFVFHEKNIFGSKIYFVLLILISIILISTGSRASFLGFLVGLSYLIYRGNFLRRRGLNLSFNIILAIVCVTIITANLFPGIAAGIIRTETESRTILWERAWELSKDAPYLGAGFGGSDELFRKDALLLRSMGYYISGSHSSLMQLLVDCGFIGVIMATTAFWFIIRRSVKRLDHFPDPLMGVCLLAVVIASLVDAIFEGWLFGFGSSSTLPFWLFLSLLSYQADLADRSDEETPY